MVVMVDMRVVSLMVVVVRQRSRLGLRVGSRLWDCAERVRLQW